MDSAQMQFFNQPSEIFCVAHGGISVHGLIKIRPVVSAAVCDRVILLAERSELRIPKRPVAQRTMNEYNRFPLSKRHVVKLNSVGDLHLLNCWQCICCLSDSRRVPRQQPCKRANHHRELLELPQYHRASPMFVPFRSTNYFDLFLKEPVRSKTSSLFSTSFPRHSQRTTN